MASAKTGTTSPDGVAGRGGGVRSNVLPLALALHGLALVVLATALGPAPPSASPAGDEPIAAASLGGGPVPLDVDAAAPDDLVPERIRLPRLPERDERAASPRKETAPRVDDADGRAAAALAALRTDTVDVRTPVTRVSALAPPEPPTELVPGTISPARFGEGTGRAGRRGRRPGGWGGVGGPGGVGTAGNGGGECAQGPSRRPPIVVERRYGFPR